MDNPGGGRHGSWMELPGLVADAGRVGGLGLGLSIARQVILQHKGTLNVDSFPGYGSTFRVTLPAWRK